MMIVRIEHVYMHATENSKTVVPEPLKFVVEQGPFGLFLGV